MLICFSPLLVFQSGKSIKNGSELSEMLKVRHVRSQLPLLRKYAHISSSTNHTATNAMLQVTCIWQAIICHYLVAEERSLCKVACCGHWWEALNQRNRTIQICANYRWNRITKGHPTGTVVTISKSIHWLPHPLVTSQVGVFYRHSHLHL